MSLSKKNLNLSVNIEKNCKYTDGNLILYIEGKEMIYSEAELSKGYGEMAEINLELAETCIRGSLEETDYYENWLCGV
ncbi:MULTISPECIES: hypothetical protein [Clostridium]|uniref:Uncharacterized protein n=1 Tax=Clostridium paridis TaxID=2803863 RepID=A0A937FGE0_9CLOT|nr:MULTISPECIES: hypothetical protein [Clostridium]MBL4931533.1 hypothetical protein [Clostridium paridis]